MFYTQEFRSSEFNIQKYKLETSDFKLNLQTHNSALRTKRNAGSLAVLYPNPAEIRPGRCGAGSANDNSVTGTRIAKTGRQRGSIIKVNNLE